MSHFGSVTKTFHHNGDNMPQRRAKNKRNGFPSCSVVTIVVKKNTPSLI